MRSRLELLALEGLPRIQPGDDLAGPIARALGRLQAAPESGDVLVVAQKIVSKSEDRYVDLRDVAPGDRAMAMAEEVDKDPRLVEFILRESTEVLRHRPGVLIVRHRNGYVHANAGIDASNIDRGESGTRVLLLPEAPDASAARLRERLRDAAGTDLPVIVNDTAGRPWRTGVVGFALGCAGMRPLEDRVGETDLFGNTLEVTRVAVADELAAAASFVMGQAAEAAPAVLIRGAGVPAAEAGSGGLIRPRAEDLFR